MSKLSIFAAVFLFWTVLTISLMQVQLMVSPVNKIRVPTYRSMPMHSTVIARMQTGATTASYN